MNYINNIPGKPNIQNAYLPFNSSNTNVDEKKQGNNSYLRKNIAQNAKEHPATQSVSDAYSDPKVLLGALFLWPVINFIVKPVNKAISGDYPNSFLGKIGNFGDKLYEKSGLNKLFGQKEAQKAGSFVKNNRFTKYFTKDFALIPKRTMVNSLGTKAELTNDAVYILKDIQKNSPNVDITNFFKESTLKDLGITSKKAAQGKVSTEYIDDLISGLDKMVKHYKKEGLSEELVLGKLRRHVRLSELRNKLITVAPKSTIEALKGTGAGNPGQTAAKTAIGRGLSKGTLKTLEGLTNGMAGGPGGIIIQAFCFAQAIKEAADAPKGEKLSTFMHVVTNDLGAYLLFAASKDVVYNFGGNKYRGMTKEGLDAFRKFLDETNQKGLTGEALKIAKAQKKLFLKGVPENVVKQFGETVTNNPSQMKTAMQEALKEAPKLKFWEKPLKKLGNLCSAGLDSIKSGKNGLLSKIPSKTKGFFGGALRFCAVLLVVAPILLKPITALCHKIFGTPTEYLKKENKSKTENKTQEENSALNQIKNNQQNLNSSAVAQNQQQNASNQNSRQLQNPQTQTQSPYQPQIPGANVQQPSQPQQPQPQQPAASTNISNSSPIRKYIPSSAPTQFNSDNKPNEEVNKLIQDCNKTLENANKLLAEKDVF